MSKGDIINFLVKVKRPVDIVELCRNIPVNRTNISRAVRKLEYDGDIKVYRSKQGCFTKHIISLK